VSILIRLGGEEGAGRGRSNVSTMIIRPPQHGHRRADEGVSASLSASACALWGETLGAESAWRARGRRERPRRAEADPAALIAANRLARHSQLPSVNGHRHLVEMSLRLWPQTQTAK
jgi:hypothetical protein